MGFIDYIKNIDTIIGAIGLLISGCLTFFTVAGNLSKRTFIKFLAREISPNVTSKAVSKEFRRRFTGYIPHRMLEITPEGKGESCTCRQFLKRTKSRRVLLIVGSSGIGKSTLMQQLAYRSRKRIYKTRAKTLSDYSVIYCKVPILSGMEDIIGDIKAQISENKDKNFSVFIDGFDELNCLHIGKDAPDSGGDASPDKVLDELINSLEREKKIKKIVISSRPEIFADGVGRLLSKNLYYGSELMLWEICGFNEKQAVNLYKNESRIQHEKPHERRQNKSRLTSFMHDNHSSVFEYPFIVTWTSELFSGMTDDEIVTSDLYRILTIIITAYLKKEYLLYLKSFANRNDAVSENRYLTSGMVFVTAAARFMMKEHVGFVSRSDIKNEIAASLNDTDDVIFSEINLTTRRLLKYIDGSEHEKNKGPRYEFIHNMIYWRLAAELLADFQVSAEERNSCLSEQSATPMPLLYLQGVFEKYTQVLDFKNSADFINSVTVKHELRYTIGDQKLDKLLLLLPEVETVRINGKLLLCMEAVADFREKKYLDLSDNGLDSAEVLAAFSPDSISALDIRGNSVSLQSIKEALACADIEHLFFSANTEDDIPGDAAEAQPFAEISVLLPEEKFSPLYKTVRNARKNGVNISILGRSSCDVDDTCRDTELLQAIYELDTLNLTRNAANSSSLMSYVNICFLYASQAMSAGNTGVAYDVLDTAMNAIFTIGDRNSVSWDEGMLNTSPRISRALDILSKAAEVQNPAAAFILGWLNHTGRLVPKNEAVAFRWFKQSAEQGNAAGQCSLGDCLLRGIGTEKDEEQAFRWFKLSAEQGYAAGQCNLGWCFQHGIGTEKDEKQAFRWFKLSAERGESTGQCNLGYCLCEGIGTEKDEEQALYWFKQSAEQENAAGQFNLGRCLCEGKGTEKNEEQAFYWFKQSAEQGIAAGQCKLGWYFRHGICTEKDEEQAFYWYKLSAENGDVIGQFNLGCFFQHGIGTEKDEEQAFRWFKMSAEQGDAAGQWTLGDFFMWGIGTEKDEKQAFCWYKLSAEQGDAIGQCSLGYCFRKGIGTEKDEKQAFYWFKQSAEQGDAIGQCSLGHCFRKGIGTEKDEEQAIYWYKLSAEQGNAAAQKRLDGYRREGTQAEEEEAPGELSSEPETAESRPGIRLTLPDEAKKHPFTDTAKPKNRKEEAQQI